MENVVWMCPQKKRKMNLPNNQPLPVTERNLIKAEEKKMNRWTKRDEMEGFPCGSAVNAGDTVRTLIWEDATEQLSP